MRISDWSSDVCSSDLSRGVGRATQPGREPSDVAKIVTLRLRGEPAQGHVVHQSLAPRAARANLDKLVHRSTPKLKESRGSASDRRRSIRRGVRRAALHQGYLKYEERFVERKHGVKGKRGDVGGN